VFEGLLPTAARWFAGPVAGGELYAEEIAAVAGAVPARRAEFAAGRAAAREAMAALGVEPVAVPVGARRMPVWPLGVVGSITHCSGLVAAAVAWAADIAALGIDAEPAAPLPADVLDAVATPAERGALDGELAGTIVFCAKEAFYKCWSALDGAVLEFHDVEVAFDAATFAAVPAGGARWPGRWAVRDGFVLAAAFRPAAGTVDHRTATS
jgi:4'-phosphopantetheinyl transferase EntD